MLAGAAACADEDTGLRERLEGGATATLDPEVTTLSMDVRYYHAPPSWRSGRVTLVAAEGTLHLSAATDGRVSVDTASVELESIDLGDAGGLTLPDRLVLTGLRLHTNERHECDAVEWSPDGKECTANVPAELLLEYHVMGGGPLVPTEGVGRAALDLELDIARPVADIAVRMRGRSDGLFSSWGEVLELRNLELSTRGVVASEEDARGAD